MIYGCISIAIISILLCLWRERYWWRKVVAYEQIDDANEQLRKQAERQNIEIREQYRELQNRQALADIVQAILRHDLKAPMKATLDNLKRLITRTKEIRTLRRLQLLESSVERQIHIMENIGDLLVFYEGIDEWMEPQERVDIGKCIERVAKLMEGITSYHQIVLEQYCEGVLWVKGNQVLLDTVLRNLLSNALRSVADKATNAGMEKGEGWVRIEAKRSTDWVVICVSDNGEGIPESVLSHIFTQATLVQKKNLGSRLITYCVKALGGNVKVRKTMVGEGTTIEVRLPIVQNQT